MEKEDLKDEMELLLSDKEATVDGKTVVVHKISLIDSIKMTSYLSAIISNALTNIEAVNSAVAKLMFNSEDERETMQIKAVGVAELLSLVGDDAPEFVGKLIVKTTNISEDDVDNVSAEAGIDLLFDIYEVNKGFFTKFMNKLQKKVGKKRATKKTK